MLDRGFVVVSTLWIAWCLCWPFIARQHDLHLADTEADQAYRVCLQQPAVTTADCKADHEAFRNRLRIAMVSPEQTAYKWFAGRRVKDATIFMAILCLAPPLILFVVFRLTLEGLLCFARFRSRHPFALTGKQT